MNVHGSSDLVQNVQSKGLCVSCGGCVSLCPYFRNHKGRTAQLFPCTLEKGRCHAFCPKMEVDYSELADGLNLGPYTGSPLGSYLEIMTARAGGKAVNGRFQAGGTVSALMAFALESGVIDGAVLTDRRGAVAEPRLVRNSGDVAACAGSKYTAAPTLAAFNEAVAQGENRLGVVGTPCQVTSLAQMRANPLDQDGFFDPTALVVGLFCTWALDTRSVLPLLNECIGSACVLCMDVPPPPSETMVIETDRGRAEIPLDKLRPLIPAGCRICPDLTSEFADISVGALEGRSHLNTLIIRTARGKALVEAACRAGALVTGLMPEESLAGLSRAAANKKKRCLDQAEQDGLLNTNEGTKRAALRMAPEAVAEIKGK